MAESPFAKSTSTGVVGTGKDQSDPFNDWENFSKSKIEVVVNKPLLKEEFLNKYFVYKIQGIDFKGDFDIQRRYSDFEKIRQLLVLRWPGCFVPSLPPKKMNNKEQAVLDDRTLNLNEFCKKVAELPHLHYSDVYQVFLRTRMSDLDPMLATYQKVKYEDIIDRFATVFGHLSGKEITNETIVKINTFYTFLKKSETRFEKYKKTSKKFVVARKNYTNKLASMQKMMSDDYEKTVFSEYHGRKAEKNVFNDESNVKNSTMEKLKDVDTQLTVELIHEWIKTEGRDLAAFAEAFAQREKYESLKSKAENKQKSETKDLQDLYLGKKTIKTLFTKENKKEETMAKMEDKINSSTKDLDNLSTIQDMITVVLAYEEIEKFKQSRVQRYYDLVGQAAEKELEAFNIVLGYWNALLDNPNVKVLEN